MCVPGVCAVCDRRAVSPLSLASPSPGRARGRLPLSRASGSARRAALFLLQNRDRLMLPLAEELGQVARSVRNCAECGNLDNADICGICRDPQRDGRLLCVVEDVGALWAMERAAG